MGEKEKETRTNDADTQNRLKQQIQFISGRGKLYISPPCLGGGSPELASAEVFTVHRSTAVVKVHWHTQDGSTAHALKISLGWLSGPLRLSHPTDRVVRAELFWIKLVPHSRPYTSALPLCV